MLNYASRRLVVSLTLMWPFTALAQDDAASDGSMMRPQLSQPSSLNDHFVGAHYDRNGMYVAPHYQPRAKPAFHGYFDQPVTDPIKGRYHDPMKLETTPPPSDDPPG